jgi:hypothetical protein
MTQLWWEQVEQVSELPSVLPKLASEQLAFQSCSQLDHTQLLLKVVSMLLSVTCMLTIGNGISMIQ